MSDLQNPIFQEDNQAREWLESQLWPEGPVCSHCGSTEATGLKGKAHRAGLYQCNSCREQFTVTVGTLFERSKIGLSKWLLATYLLCASKKGISTRQLSRMLGVSVKSTWLMTHRIREAMREGKFTGSQGDDNTGVEADETYVGGKARNAKKGAPISEKDPAVALVERDGSVQSFHVSAVSRDNLRLILNGQMDKATYLMTDDAPVYPSIGCEYAGHVTVNHWIKAQVRGVFLHTDAVEN